MFCWSFLGKNVVCFRTGLKDRQQARAINQYCWVTGTYTENEENVHSYYQWVPYMLLLQGALFYLPKIVWGQFEQGKMNSICKEILTMTKVNKDYHQKVKDAAGKVTKYIRCEQAGHLKYGYGYVCAKVCFNYKRNFQRNVYLNIFFKKNQIVFGS